MQEVREKNILKLKAINSDSEEEPLVTTKTAVQRSNSLSEEISQKGRGRPKKEQRPRTGSIDVYLSPRTEKRKLQDSPEEENKKEVQHGNSGDGNRDKCTAYTIVGGIEEGKGGAGRNKEGNNGVN